MLALCAAAVNPGIRKLALLEPPIEFDAEPDTAFARELEAHIAAGDLGGAVEFFHRGIGVPDEILDGLREGPMWPRMVSAAHTLAYDTEIMNSFRPERLASITTPTLVINSQGSTDDLSGWAGAVAERLPNGTQASLKGEWHGVAPEVLAPVLKDFLR